MKIFESDIKNMVKKAVFLLMENGETNNINAAKQYLKAIGHEEDYSNIIDLIRHKIPNIRLGKYKFLLGACIYYINGSLNDNTYVEKFNQLLEVMTRPEYINNYERSINKKISDFILDFDDIIKKELEADKNNSASITHERNDDYTIVPIDTFEKAEKYGIYTSWCVTHSRCAFDDYSNEGAGKFYFCLKKGFENISKVAGENCPLDEYGLSMIAVCVGPDGSLKSCTCRWNHENGGDDKIMNAKDISKLLGCDFYDVFKPNTNFRGEVNDLLKRVNSGEPIPVIFDEVISNGVASRVEYKGLYNFIVNGKYLSDTWFDDAGGFTDDDIAWDFLDSKGYTFIKLDGTYVINKWFESAYSFHDGLAIVELYTNDNNGSNLLKKDGTFLFKKNVFNILRMSRKYRGVFCVQNNQGESYFAYNNNGMLLSKNPIGSTDELEQFIKNTTIY